MTCGSAWVAEPVPRCRCPARRLDLVTGAERSDHPVALAKPPRNLALAADYRGAALALSLEASTVNVGDSRILG